MEGPEGLLFSFHIFPASLCFLLRVTCVREAWDKKGISEQDKMNFGFLELCGILK